MNNIKNLLIIILALSISSCDDYLDPDSLSTFDTAYVFSNTDDARKATNAMYVHFSHDGFRSRLSNNMTGNTDIEHNGGSSDGARYQIWRLDAQENNGDLQYIWDIGYKAIRDANIVIEGVLASEGYYSEDVVISGKMKQFIGEAYTMRAYWYSMLIYYFGDIPYVTQAPKYGVEFNLPKEDRNVILSNVIQDLIDVEADMKWADDLPYGVEQINREYALGMIARIALQRGGYFLTPEMQMIRKSDYLDYYKIAKDYTSKLMTLKDRDLPTDFKQIFLNECKFIVESNGDMLFEVPFAIGEGDVAWNIGISVTAGDHPYGSGGNYMNVPPSYFYSFDTVDKRRDVTCGLHRITTDFEKEVVSVSSISQGKWSRECLDPAPGSSTAKGTGINWPMMRYSDVILMYAEAENELNGPTASAQAALKRVRQRAFDSADWGDKVDLYTSTVSTDKNSFFDAIVDERAWEFGGEMIRKYELIRWNLYETKVSETVAEVKKMADDAELGLGTLPDYIYVKNDTNGDLLIYNIDEKVVAAPDESWERVSWLRALNSSSDPSGYQEWVTRDWANYTDPVRYIFPLPILAISNSQGLLENDGYGF